MIFAETTLAFGQHGMSFKNEGQAFGDHYLPKFSITARKGNRAVVIWVAFRCTWFGNGNNNALPPFLREGMSLPQGIERT